MQDTYTDFNLYHLSIFVFEINKHVYVTLYHDNMVLRSRYQILANVTEIVISQNLSLTCSGLWIDFSYV